MSDESREAFEKRVVEAAKARLKDKPWFKGVCVDTLREFGVNQFDKAVESVCDETVYWDAPNLGFDNPKFGSDD